MAGFGFVAGGGLRQVKMRFLVTHITFNGIHTHVLRPRCAHTRQPTRLTALTRDGGVRRASQNDVLNDVY